MFATALLAVTLSAPVPKSIRPADPGETWAFPDLRSSGWREVKGGVKVWDVKEGEGEILGEKALFDGRYQQWLTDGIIAGIGGLGVKPGDGPRVFNMADAMGGWKVGLAGMREGGIRRLIVPAELAYGKDGVPNLIPADATIVFTVEVVSVGK